MNKYLSIIFSIISFNLYPESLCYEEVIQIEWQSHIWDVKLLKHSRECKCFYNEDLWIDPDLMVNFTSVK